MRRIEQWGWIAARVCVAALFVTVFLTGCAAGDWAPGKTQPDTANIPTPVGTFQLSGERDTTFRATLEGNDGVHIPNGTFDLVRSASDPLRTRGAQQLLIEDQRDRHLDRTLDRFDRRLDRLEDRLLLAAGGGAGTVLNGDSDDPGLKVMLRTFGANLLQQAETKFSALIDAKLNEALGGKQPAASPPAPAPPPAPTGGTSRGAGTVVPDVAARWDY